MFKAMHLTLSQPSPVGYGGGDRDMRSTSPLRHEVSSEDGDEDEDPDRARSPFGRYAVDFARSVSSLMSPAKSTSTLPSDAELEAEAQRERDRSRREAERIMMQEARDRRRVEERVLAMLENPDPSLAPPPPRTASTPGSPSSQKDRDGGWWSQTKSKLLTPTKEPLTPAQQIILDAKAKEKAQRKADKAAEKADKKAREQQWPAKPQTKYTDPALATLALAASPPVPSPQDEEEAPLTPLRPPPRRFSTPQSMNTSPGGANGSPSNGREAPPIYAQFDGVGTLDVPSTLLVIARRFEKLEKWTVGHVRALEERMSDVEKWLVDKERDREEHPRVASSSTAQSSVLESEVEGMREEMAELQGRIGTLGREMAKMAMSAATAPMSTPPLGRNPSTTSQSAYAVKFIPTFNRTPSSISRPTSPPTSSVISAGSNIRTRLPYPTGDYASPGSSPPPQLATSPNVNMILTGLVRSDSPTPAETTEYALPPPKAPAMHDSPRAGSVSPTLRKRYTVALGDPITGRKDEDEAPPPTPTARKASGRVGTAFFTDMSGESDSDFDVTEETIGKSAARRVSGRLPTDASASPSPAPSDFRGRRAKAQSAYGFGAVAASPSESTSNASRPTAPLRLRSQSTEGFNVNLPSASSSTSGLGLGISSDGSGRFLDPYEARKAEREREASIAPMPPKVHTGRKVPLGQLVAFFDKDKQ
jgi:hypothetical protein